MQVTSCKCTQCVNILKNTLTRQRVFFLWKERRLNKRTSFQPRVGNFSNAWERRLKEMVRLCAPSSTDLRLSRQKGGKDGQVGARENDVSPSLWNISLRVFTKVSRMSSQVSYSRCRCVWMKRVHVNIHVPEIMIEVYCILSKFCIYVYKKKTFIQELQNFIFHKSWKAEYAAVLRWGVAEIVGPHFCRCSHNQIAKCSSSLH